MDLDGLMLLMDRDAERFNEWFKKSDSMSLDELRKGYLEWSDHYYDAHRKYDDLGSNNPFRDSTLFAANISYFYVLSDFCRYALSFYTVRLEEVY